MNLSDLKMVNLLPWVFEKGPEIFYEMLFLFSTMPTAKLLIVPNKYHKNQNRIYNLHCRTTGESRIEMMKYLNHIALKS